MCIRDRQVIDLAVVGTPKSATASSTTGGVLSVLYGVGDGTYRAPQIFDIPTQAMSVKAIDVNNDTRRDLLTSGSGDSFSLFMNGASGCLLYTSVSSRRTWMRSRCTTCGLAG